MARREKIDWSEYGRDESARERNLITTGISADGLGRIRQSTAKRTIIICVLGGVTYAEIHQAAEIERRTGCTVLIGGTEVLSPSAYLDRLSMQVRDPLPCTERCLYYLPLRWLAQENGACICYGGMLTVMPQGDWTNRQEDDFDPVRTGQAQSRERAKRTDVQREPDQLQRDKEGCSTKCYTCCGMCPLSDDEPDDESTGARKLSHQP